MNVDRGGAGTRELDGATLAIWERVDGYYWLIDGDQDEIRRADVGPFETELEAEQDARAWWASEHAAEDPFLEPDTIDLSEQADEVTSTQ